MSTRGVYGFYKGGKTKITYNHSDSYPGVLGSNVVEFVKDTPITELNEIFDRIILVDNKEEPTVEQVEECQKWADLFVSAKDLTEWYVLLRMAQGDLYLYKEGLRYMIDSEDFIKDSLFCEWGYIINLDDNILEIYRGYQESPQENRYYTDRSLDAAVNFYNCKLLCSFPLEDIPDNWEEIILKEESNEM